MNNFNSFFDNLLPLRPLIPFVQSVLPTVFDDSLSYLETLGKVVKALNDTESNVNTLEQATRAFASELEQYVNKSIVKLEITLNAESGEGYTASMTYAEVMAAINAGHTVVAHVVGQVSMVDVDFYSASMKIDIVDNVYIIYWGSPVYRVNGETVFYNGFLMGNNTAGIYRHTVSNDDNNFIVHFDSDSGTADKTFLQISNAINNEKTVLLIADNYYINDAKWVLSGDNISRVDFFTAAIIPNTAGAQLGTVQYSVRDSDTWTVSRYEFPDMTRVNTMIDDKLAQHLDDSIVKLSYDESTGAVTYYDGEQTLNATGQLINSRFLSTAKRLPILEGFVRVGDSGALFAYYFPVRYGTVGNDEVVEFYRVFNGNYELVSVPWSSNIAVKTSTPIGSAAADGSIVKLSYDESTGAVTYYDGEQTINATGQLINSRFLSTANRLPILEGFVRVGNSGALFAYYFPVRYGTVENGEVVEFYRVFNGNYELVSVPWSSNIAVKTSRPIGGAAVDDIVWGYEDEYSGNAVIRKRSDNNIYTASQMATDANARKLILIETVHGLYYLSSASTVLGVSTAVFFNGGTYTMVVDDNGIYVETPVSVTPAIPEITNTETTIQTTIDPNKFYVFPNAGKLTIDFNAGTSGVVNEYHFRFTSGSTATQLDLPETVEIPDDFDVAANTVYEISIIDNYMVYSSWAVSA